MMETITDVLVSGEDISIVGFGKIGTRRAGRVGKESAKLVKKFR